MRWFGHRPPLALGCVVTVVVAGLASLSLLFATSAAEVYRAGVQVWTTSAGIGYVVCVLLLEVRRSATDLDRLAASLPGPRREPGSNPFAHNRHPHLLAAFTLAGCVFGIAFNIAVGGVLYEMLTGLPPTWLYAWAPFVLMLLWSLVFHTLWILIDNCCFLARIGEHEVRVDLNHPGAFDVFVNAGTRHLLLLIGGLAIFPIQGILGGGIEPRHLLPAAVVIFPVGLFLFAWPLVAVRRAMLREQRAELARIDEQLAAAVHLGDRYLLLSLHRHQIAALPAWPLTLRNLARVALYLVIPPLTWVAAAIVDTLVSRYV